MNYYDDSIKLDVARLRNKYVKRLHDLKLMPLSLISEFEMQERESVATFIDELEEILR